MRRPSHVKHEFVEFIPGELEPGTIYISGAYATCSHLCLCGCGEKVVTPLAPTEWKLEFNGETISLCPSIGNWSFDCQSHYWIEHGRVLWAPTWSRERIDTNRDRDRRQKEWYYDVPSDLERVTPRAPHEPGRLRRALRHIWPHRQ